jgi:hypothetical protein
MSRLNFGNLVFLPLFKTATVILPKLFELSDFILLILERSVHLGHRQWKHIYILGIV